MTTTASNRTPAPSPGLLASLSPAAPDRVRSALERGSAIEAFMLALEAKDYAAASDVLRIGWYDVLRDGPQHGGIRGRLETIPLDELTEHPLLALALGLAYNADGFRRAKAAQYFAIASEAGSGRAGLSDGDQVLFRTGQSAAMRIVGQTTMAARAAQAALAGLDAMGRDRSARLGFLPRVYSQLGISLYAGGLVTEALDAFLKGYAEEGVNDPASFGSLAMLAGVHALNGDLREARTFIEIARGDAWTDLQRSTYVGVFYRLGEAVSALEAGEPALAQQHLDAMRHDRRSIEHWIPIARVEAMTVLAAGDPAGALARLEAFASLRATEERAAPNRRALASVRVLLHLALGNIDSATAILERDAPDEPQTAVDRARLALVTGNPGAALNDLRTIAGVPQSARTRAEAAAIGAAASLRTATTRRAAGAVDQLGAILRESQQRLALALLPAQDLAAVASQAAELGYADVLAGPPLRSVLLEADAPVELTPRELKVLRALADSASTADLAAELFVSVNTVKSQLRSVYRKLGVSGRDEAIAAAIERHLLDRPAR